MQESRLFQIVYYLLKHGQVTAADLAEKLEVSVRTIYRDIDVLSGAGIPVYAEQGRGGGIGLLDDFVLEKAVLSAQEKQEIFSSLAEYVGVMAANRQPCAAEAVSFICNENRKLAGGGFFPLGQRTSGPGKIHAAQVGHFTSACGGDYLCGESRTAGHT